MIFIGHSLGCHIISSYVWDLNKLKQRSEASIQAETGRRNTQRVGSAESRQPIPPARHARGPCHTRQQHAAVHLHVRPGAGVSDHPVAARLRAQAGFPGSTLPPALADKARWLNFYSKRDLLGFPLKPLNPAYGNEPRLHDIAVRTETLTSRTLPYWSHLKAHTNYWKNPTVVRQTAALIQDIAETA